MLERIKGCLLGAAVGDALGMPNESTMPGLTKMRYGFRKAYKGHPNSGLAPGQYTDDTQMMILVATLLADGRYTDERYGLALKELYAREVLRFPDGSVSAACDHMVAGQAHSCGVKSTTAGCLPAALPLPLSIPMCTRELRGLFGPARLPTPTRRPTPRSLYSLRCCTTRSMRILTQSRWR